MINTISSSLASFRNLEFKKGLNIVVAKRHNLSGNRGTRNGSGKTSLIELIHYLFAEKKVSGADFYRLELSDFEFVIDTNEGQFKKSIFNGKEILSVDGSSIDRKDARRNLEIDWFQLSPEITNEKFSPTFSAMFSYFVRKNRNGAFMSAINNSNKQQNWDAQVNLSYLLGFDWTLPQNLQKAKEDKKEADSLLKMLKSGLLNDFDLDPKTMQARFDILEDEIDRKRDEIREAVVVDDYRGREELANELTRKIRDCNEANLIDIDLIEDIDSALAEVKIASKLNIKKLYNNVGIFFPDTVTKRFKEVTAFHKAVSKNRAKHLAIERSDAEERLKVSKLKIASLQSELKEHTRVLTSGVAIERYATLQSELNTLENELGNLSVMIPRIRDVNEAIRSKKHEIDRLLELIELDVLERAEARTRAVKLFAEISRHLYDEPGTLSIGRTQREGGLYLGTDIQGKKSGGKSNMQIFCFDLMLAIVSKHNGKFPGFLIHDSHIFDGVDGRQIGLALDIAQKKCEEFGIQYIVTVNSDDLQKIENEEATSGESIFDPRPFINEQQLDDTDAGGLFGFRF